MTEPPDTNTIEGALRAAQEQVAEDLRRMTRLHDLSMRLAEPGDLRRMLETILRAAVDITAAEMGNIQSRDDAGALTIAAQIGFHPPFREFFARVDNHSDSACGSAMASRERVIVEDVTRSPIFADSPSLPVLLAAGVRAVQSTPLFDRSGRFLGVLSTHYRMPHRFDATELRWLDVLARHAADLLERRGAAFAREEVDRRVAERTQWLSLRHDVSHAINESRTWDEALTRVLRSICELGYWQIGYIYLSDPVTPDVMTAAIGWCGDERFQAFHMVSKSQRHAPGHGLPGRAYVERQQVWINTPEDFDTLIPKRKVVARQLGLQTGVALPIAIGREVVAVLELFSGERQLGNDQLATVMQDISYEIGRVIERERATARMADLIWQEQQNLLHTLHDSLGQTLTGIGMLSASLRQQVSKADPATVAAADTIARQAQVALDQVRQLTKRLFPLEVDPENLVAALHDLASTAESLYGIPVRVEGRLSEGIQNGSVAMQLYRIAQEAVTNAARHAKPQTIAIELQHEAGLIILRVIDDGLGGASAEASDGMGRRIMRYRATSVGASLSIEAGAERGTAVTCMLRDTQTLESL
jgi:signal transduction histidine kinase